MTAPSLLVLAAGMMLMVSRRVTGPLNAIRAAMLKLAGGDFDVVLPGLHRKDEIGAVANAVERFKVLAVDKARRAFEYSQLQMQAGTTNVLTVLNTETALFTAQDTLVQVKYQHLQSLVDLYQALGGGWRQAQADQ